VNGVHDLGGMHGFGPIEREIDEPVFHSQWEARLFAVRLALVSAGHLTVDEFRRAIEQMPPASYLATTYYGRWLYGLECLLVEKQIVSLEELATHRQRLSSKKTGFNTVDAVNLVQPKPGTRAAPVESFTPRAGRQTRDTPQALFKAGDIVVARNTNVDRHIRLPRYARGRRGVVRRDWGVFVLPDMRAHGLGDKPQHCYWVEFIGREIWGEDQNFEGRIYLDLWEDYLTVPESSDDRSADNWK
jgi:nitrile hydratase beta subunit